MKYMGSKRVMLLNGLGDALRAAMPGHRRFVDLFTGSAAVAWHVAKNYDVEVIASDLQKFAVVLASSVVSRTTPLTERSLDAWLARAAIRAKESPLYVRAMRLQDSFDQESIAKIAGYARELSALGETPITFAYGGYYFSPMQALLLDALRTTLPRGQASQAALASLVWTASRCAASPGHTAQPFKANRTAGIYLEEAWQKDILSTVRTSFEAIAPIYSRRRGVAVKEDANILAKKLRKGDLVFIDPPYSGVHYSRFYHVLETLVGHDVLEVSGSGRYPSADRRPRSEYSLNQGAREALSDLFDSLAAACCDAIVTFPVGAASNGLSGEIVSSLAEKSFKIKSAKVSSRFSTLGGNLRNRQARQSAEELILTLTPR